MFNLIDFDYNKINNNIDKLKDLPQDIYDKIIINNNFNGLSNNSNFNKIVNNIKCDKLEDIIKSGCINKKSLYELGDKIIQNGFNCIKLNKGLKLYRFHTGFLTNDKINQLLYDRHTCCYLLYSKYLAYSYARLCFGGITCYELSNDIILLDLFNYDNIKIIINLFYKYTEVNTNLHYLSNLSNITEFFKYMTGFDVTLNEQIIYFNKLYNNRSHIFIYDKITSNNYNNIYKNIYYETKLNIYNIRRDDTPYMFRYLNYIFLIVLNNYIKIDGIILKQVFSQLSDNGLYDHEQIFMKPESQLKNLIYNHKNKLNWTNWNITDFNINKYINIMIQIHYVDKSNGSLSNNNDFKLLLDYYKYPLNYINIKNNITQLYSSNKKYFLSYNIDNLFYLNGLDRYDNVINKIIKLIRKINKFTNNNLDYIYLLNTNTFFKYYFEVIKLRLYKINYHFIYHINNNNLLICKYNSNVKMDYINIFNDFDKTIIDYFNYPYYDIYYHIKNRINYKNDLFLLDYLDKKILFYNFIYPISYHNIKLNDKAIQFIYDFNNNMITKEIDQLNKYNPDIIICNLKTDKFDKYGYKLGKSINNIDNHINVYSKYDINDNYYIEYSNLFQHLPLLSSL